MKNFLKLSCLFLFSVSTLFGWENEPELMIEGVFQELQITRTIRYSDGTEEKRLDKQTVLISDKPITLTKSLTLANNQVVLQQESFPYLHVNLGDEFMSLIGKKVRVFGHLTKPLDFFFHDDIGFDINTALDLEWMQSHQSINVSYEPTKVKLAGKIYEKTYPGPPEYNSITDGDLPETVMILTLSEPIDMKKTGDLDDNETERGVREIQVVFSESAPPKSLWNQKVILSGSLFHAHTAHHRRRVLMMVDHWGFLNSEL